MVVPVTGTDRTRPVEENDHMSSFSPLRRFAVTAAMIGAAVFGSVALAPAASADESAPAVVEQASVVEAAPAPEVVPAPTPSQVVPAPPEIVYDKNGRPVKAPKPCTTTQLDQFQQQAAKAVTQADALKRAAFTLRDAAAKLRAQAAVATGSSARLLTVLANAGDAAANALENKAAELLEAASVLPCIPPGGGRF
jgi:hypothetical protein